MQKIMVVGDVHGDWSAFNKMLNRKKPDMVLQCGDFGYWPRFREDVNRHTGKRPGPKAQNSKIYWCDGNHEDHESLQLRDTDELWPSVFYMPRGSTLQLPDGRTVMFMGGADSIDKNFRTLGHDWFREETISWSDIENLDNNLKVDIIVSHTCPQVLLPVVMNQSRYASGECNDPSTKALSHLFQLYKPKRWYFGHWHKFVNFKFEDCDFTGLSYPASGDKWYVDLND